MGRVGGGGGCVGVDAGGGVGVDARVWRRGRQRACGTTLKCLDGGCGSAVGV